MSCFDLDPTVLKGGLAGFDESRQMDEQGTFTSFYSQDLCNQVDMWWLIEDHGDHIYLALDSLCFLFCFIPFSFQTITVCLC